MGKNDASLGAGTLEKNIKKQSVSQSSVIISVINSTQMPFRPNKMNLKTHLLEFVLFFLSLEQTLCST